MSPAEHHEHYLEVHGDAGKMNRFLLEDKSIVIGRSRECDLMLDHSDVSRRHAELSINELGQWSVRDVGSRNGTYVNGKKLNPTGENDGWKVMEPGDRIDLAAFGLVLSIGTPALDWAIGSEVSYVNVNEGDPNAPVFVLDTSQATQVTPAQLWAIGDLGAQMVQIQGARKRLDALSQFLLSDQMNCLASIAIRLIKNPPTAPPRALSEWIFKPGWDALPKIYVSRTALRKVLATSEPVLAGAGIGAGTEMSIVTESPMAVIACPLHSDAKVLDLIYLMVDPLRGTNDFLALIALSVQQFNVGQIAARLRTDKKGASRSAK